MFRNSKLLLIIAISLSVVGLSIELGMFKTKGMPVMHVLLPVGAIFIGLYLVSRFLAKEDELHAEDQKKTVPASVPVGKVSRQNRR